MDRRQEELESSLRAQELDLLKQREEAKYFEK